MLNTVLAAMATLIWSASYGWYFRRDMRRWWRTRGHRRYERKLARERAVQIYAAWVRDIPGPRPRAPVVVSPLPVPPARQPAAAPARASNVVPFPVRRRATPR